MLLRRTRRALQVEIYVDGELFLGRALAPGTPLRIGADRDCEIPTTLVPATLPLLTPNPDGYGLHLSPPLNGTIRTGGRSLRVRDGLLCDPRPEPLRLVEGDGAEIQLSSSLHLRIQVISAARSFARRPTIDFGLAASLAGSLAAAVLAILLVVRFAPVRPPSTGKEVRLQSRPALVSLSRLVGPSQITRRREAALRAPRAAAPARRRVEILRADPAERGSAERRGILGALDPSLSHFGAPRRRRLDPLASIDRLLTSTAAGQTAGTGSRSSRDRSGGVWLSHVPRPLPVALAELPRPRLRAPSMASPSAARGLQGPAREAIRDVVAAGAGAVRLCYERELLSSTESGVKPSEGERGVAGSGVAGSSVAEGRLLLRWRIDSTGHATAIRVERDTVRLAGLRECLIRQLRSWAFPPCPDSCEITYPFEFFTRS